MPVITGLGVTKSYARDILSEIGFALEADDRVGLIGRNGEGKTTLLRLLAGLDEPSKGIVERRRGLRVGYLPQDPPAVAEQTLWQAMLHVFDDLRRMQEQMETIAKALAGPEAGKALLAQFGQVQHEFESRGGYHYEIKIKTILGGLGFGHEQYAQPMAQLSGGQRTQALLGRLLLEEPDVLLLDEPTNHLDLEAVEWLERWLGGFHGATVIVSHDRYFLDRTVNRIWEIAATRLNTYRGDYSGYLHQRQIDRLSQERTWQKQQTRIAKDEEFIRRNFAAQKHKQAQSRQKALDKLRQTEFVDRPQEQRDMRLKLQPALRSGDQVFKIRDLVVGYSADKPLVSAGDLKVSRGQRVAMVGGNGVGKTTLLRTMLGQLGPLAGSVQRGASLVVGYLPQTHDNLNNERTVIQTIFAVDESLNNEQARGILGCFLFSNEDVFKRVGQLSGGERSRLVLASLAVQGANLLMLDEPTNHLDIASQEVLQDVLSQFEGTVVFVSHDRYLIDQLATHIWVFENGGIISMTGNWHEFLRWRSAKLAEAASPVAPAQPKPPAQPQVQKVRISQPAADGIALAQQRERRKERARLAKRQEQQEAAIAKLEKQLEELSGTISSASVEGEDMKRVHQLADEYQQLDGKLKYLWKQWTELGEQLERLEDVPADA